MAWLWKTFSRSCFRAGNRSGAVCNSRLSHDIDLTGVPPRLRSALGHLYPRGIPDAFLRDVAAFANLCSPAYLEAIRTTASISRSRRIASAFYWQVAERTAWDEGYAIADPRVKAVFDELCADGYEMGIHPGYRTFDSPERLRQEVAVLRGFVGDAPIGGRQHYLRWSPATWKHWEDAGLAYDSTLGFADAIGFRSGTCLPYHPWLFQENRESSLLEIPLIVMDCTPVRYMSLSKEQALHRIAALVDRCQAVGGVFTLLWHNASVIERPYADLYPRILDMLDSTQSYDWTADAEPSAVPMELALR